MKAIWRSLTFGSMIQDLDRTIIIDVTDRSHSISTSGSPMWIPNTLFNLLGWSTMIYMIYNTLPRRTVAFG